MKVVFVIILLYLAALLAAIKALSLLKHIIHRLAFAGKLNKAVKKQGGSVKMLHSPLRSLFFTYSGEDIFIELPRWEKISIKFFPGFSGAKDIVLQDSKTALIKRRMGLMGRNAVTVSSNSFATKKKRFTADFSTNAKTKILLFSPDPFSISCMENGRRVPVDSGSEIFGATLFTSGTYLKKLAR